MRTFPKSSGYKISKKMKNSTWRGAWLPRMWSFLVILCLLASLVACKSETSHASASLFALDTYVTISVDGKEAEAAVQAASTSLHTYEEMFSRHHEGGEIAKLNQATVEQPATLSEDTYQLLSLTCEYAILTDGTFDPTVAPLMDLWGIGTEHARVPDKSEIDEVLTRINYRNVQLLPNHQAYVKDGAQVDLGGAAKGAIGDLLMAKMREFDVTKIILDLGGNICIWAKNDTLRVGVTSPLKMEKQDQQSMCAIVTITDSEQPTSVVTSGAYERFFEQDGIRYGHIMDTRTGAPVQTDLLSATIVGSDGAVCDILSTTLYAMGLEHGREWAQDRNIDCILCAENGTLWVSSSLKGRVDAEEGWTIEYFG